MIYGKEEISKKKETSRKDQVYGARAICLPSLRCQGDCSNRKRLPANSKYFMPKGMI